MIFIWTGLGLQNVSLSEYILSIKLLKNEISEKLVRDNKCNCNLLKMDIYFPVYGNLLLKRLILMIKIITELVIKWKYIHSTLVIWYSALYYVYRSLWWQSPEIPADSWSWRWCRWVPGRRWCCCARLRCCWGSAGSGADNITSQNFVLSQ